MCMPHPGTPFSREPCCSLLLEPRSLLTFRGEAYTHCGQLTASVMSEYPFHCTHCLHGIDAFVEEGQLDASVCNLHLACRRQPVRRLGWG